MADDVVYFSFLLISHATHLELANEAFICSFDGNIWKVNLKVIFFRIVLQCVYKLFDSMFKIVRYLQG